MKKQKIIDYLPKETDTDEELVRHYLNLMDSFGDLIYYGRGYLMGIAFVEETFGVKDISLIAPIFAETDDGYHKEIVREGIENITESILFPFCLKCNKPMDNLKFVNLVTTYLDKEVYQRLGDLDELDTVDCAYQLVDMLIQEFDGILSYSDLYKRYIDILDKDRKEFEEKYCKE